MCEAFGAEGVGEALTTLGEAMDSLGNIANGFAKGGVLGGIAAAAGEVMGWIGKIFSASDKKHEKKIQRMQEQIDALQKAYDRLGKAAEEAFSTDASGLIAQQDTLLRQQRALVQQQMEEEQEKKKTDKEKVQQYQDQLQSIDEALSDNAKKAKEALIGEDLKSAINEFASLYAEAWSEGKAAAQKSTQAVKNIVSSALSEMLKKNIQPAATKFYDALAQAMERGMTEADLYILDNLKKEMDEAAQASEEMFRKVEQRYKDLDELREELTDISFDSVSDNFKSLLSDMDSSARAFTDSFTDMLRNALVQGLMDSKYDKLLKE